MLTYVQKHWYLIIYILSYQSRPRENGRHFAETQIYFFNGNYNILMQIWPTNRN